MVFGHQKNTPFPLNLPPKPIDVVVAFVVTARRVKLGLKEQPTHAYRREILNHCAQYAFVIIISEPYVLSYVKMWYTHTTDTYKE